MQSALYCFNENDIRSGLHPVDQALTLKDLKKISGLSDEKLAEKIHRNQSYVTDRIRILDLPKDILNSIGTNRKAHFRFAHAVELSRHARSDRLNSAYETRKLYEKTVACKLTSDQLEEIVRFIKDGSYDCLPGNLRTLILNDECMTPKVANLFLCPESFFEVADGDDSKNTKRLMEKAANLTKDEHEAIVLTAIEERWSERHLGRHLQQILDSSSSSDSKEEKDPAKVLDSQFSSLMHKLRDSEYDVDNFGPEDLTELCDGCQRLINRLTSFYHDISELAKSKTKNNNNQK